MEHLLVIFQIILLSFGFVAVFSLWFIYFKDKRRELFAFCVFFTSLTFIVCLNAILSYFSLNSGLKKPSLIFGFFILEQIPRIVAVLATVYITSTVLPSSLGRFFNVFWLLILLSCSSLLFLDAFALDIVEHQKNSPGIMTTNISQMCAILFSVLLCLYKFKVNSDNPIRKMLRFWIIFSAVSIPGLLLDFLIYPQLLTDGIYTIPLLAYYRVYFVILSFYILHHVYKYLQHTIFKSKEIFTINSKLLSEQHGLTPRESEILEFLLEGTPNKYISSRLGVSLNTVKVHVYNIFQKTGAGNRVELIYMLQEKFRN